MTKLGAGMTGLGAGMKELGAGMMDLGIRKFVYVSLDTGIPGCVKTLS